MRNHRRSGPRLLLIALKLAAKKAVFYFYWQPRYEVSISELVSFVISRVDGTEVISLDARVNDFPSRVAQFSLRVREKASRRIKQRQQGASRAPRVSIASQNATRSVSKKKAMRNSATCCRVKIRRQAFVISKFASLISRQKLRSYLLEICTFWIYSFKVYMYVLSVEKKTRLIS